MFTVTETDAFVRYARTIWSDAERVEFGMWIANNPLRGTLISETGGIRNVRYARQGMGKRGGSRVIYYNLLDDGKIWLLTVYSKAKLDNLPTAFLNKLKAAVLESTDEKRKTRH